MQEKQSCLCAWIRYQQGHLLFEKKTRRVSKKTASTIYKANQNKAISRWNRKARIYTKRISNILAYILAFDIIIVNNKVSNEQLRHQLPMAHESQVVIRSTSRTVC